MLIFRSALVYDQKSEYNLSSSLQMLESSILAILFCLHLLLFMRFPDMSPTIHQAEWTVRKGYHRLFGDYIQPVSRTYVWCWIQSRWRTCHGVIFSKSNTDVFCKGQLYVRTWCRVTNDHIKYQTIKRKKDKKEWWYNKYKFIIITVTHFNLGKFNQG